MKKSINQINIRYLKMDLIDTDSRYFEEMLNRYRYGITSDGGSISKVGGPKPMIRFSLSTTKDGSGVARNFKEGGA